MKHLIFFRWVAVLTLAIVLPPSPASAQETDTLSISGTFGMDSLKGTVGEDLAYVFAENNDHGWTLTLHGVSYSHEYDYDVSSTGYYDEYITRVHATSFDFRFFGPDADELNAVVSQQLVSGGLGYDAFLELKNTEVFDYLFPGDTWSYSTFTLGLSPVDRSTGIFFIVYSEAQWWLWSTDEAGFPLVEPQRVETYFSSITDQRPGNGGGLESYNDLVDIGSSEPPLPPPPPPLPTLSIADASKLEGNKGTSLLDLTVTLSNISSDVVRVDYTTANGTALAKSDYNAASGTLSIQPGQTQGTISIAIKGDRKREPHETFSVQLSNAVGATINDGVATATILNDD